MLLILKAAADGHGTIDMARHPAPGEPTPAQAEAGNYRKRLVKWQGLTIAVENEAGSVRYGNGWQTRMLYDYGYVQRSEGVDGDEVDVYLGPALDYAPMVYVVHQRKYGDWDAYDEDKAMVGFMSEDDAAAAYLKHYDDPRFLGPITAMPVDEFVAKVKATREKPAMIKAHVGAYTKKDGTFVAEHDDKRQRHARYAELFKPSLGHRREDMPQVPNGIKPEFLDRLRKAGVTVEHASVDPGTLKPTQANYNAENMDYLTGEARAGKFEAGNPCLVSSDGRVLDGHHRWAVAALEGMKLLIVRIGMPIKELMKVAEEFNVEHGIERRLSTGGLDRMTKGGDFGHLVLLLKGRVGPYLRQGRLVNMTGYDGRQARATPGNGQMSLFGEPERKPLGPSPYKDKDPVLDTPDLFDGKTPRERQADKVEMPREEAVAEHKRLVAVLRSPSHEDDKAEAEKQAAELREYEGVGRSNPQAPPITMTSKRRVKVDMEGTHTEVTLSNGAKRRIQRLNSAASMGLPGWHDLDKPSNGKNGWAGHQNTYLADNEDDAIRALLEAANREEPAAPAPAPAAPPAPAPDDDHPSKPTRSLLGMIPEDRRAEWLELHKLQHELHHHELGQIRELMQRARTARNRAETPMREMEATAAEYRRSTLPGSQERAEAAEAAAAKHREAYNKHRAELDRLSSVHQNLYEQIGKLRRQKDEIAAPSGDLDVDWAAMRKRTSEEQEKHEASMLKRYREHYKAKDSAARAAKRALIVKKG